MISQKLSIYIPHVFANITKERIVDVFNKQSIGEVERIDFVPKKGKDGREYHMAFIHMKCWYNNECVENLLHAFFLRLPMPVLSTTIHGFGIFMRM